MKPEYKHGSLVNLMASFGQAMSYDAGKYAPASLLSPQELESYDNIVFLLIDGLGIHNLKQYGENSTIIKHLRGELTSVFPSTTSAAITTLATGLAPMQHANTGWFMYLRELGTVTAILPFVPRCGGEKFSARGIKVRDIIDCQSIYQSLDRSSYIINRDFLVDSDFSLAVTEGAIRRGYENLDGFYQSIVESIHTSDEKKYIYAYWPDYDGLCHTYGVGHEKTAKHFQQIDSGFSSLLDTLKGSNSIVILTADHGLIDTSQDKVVYLEDYPAIKDCLRLPLCGEPRACFCYLKSGFDSTFVSLVKEQLHHICDLMSVSELIEQNYFGLGESHPELANRIGDYVLIAKENYVIKDKLLGEKDFSQVGVHGGLSEKEMLVPLVVATP
ncbi:MAG: alkaline phosphatase family protein [Gammaproteobacteria bacterium]|nr:alkaline phosphatase family protein [Gammaproteobacteria bacterium]